MSVLLDTCVLSELRKPQPTRSVTDFLAQMPPDDTWLSVITIAELVRGIEQMSPGRRRTEFEVWCALTETSFADRILPVDIEAARIWGQLTARLRARGIQLPAADGLIAATALAHNLAVVTRSVRDFHETGVRVIDPWGDDGS